MYTGTGTQEDPYLVSNLTDFLECVAIANAYIKVIADIDAADDENYTGEISTLTINCKELYADELKIIEGITVYATNFIRSSGGITLRKLFFKNCEHKFPVSTAACFINAGTRNNYTNVNNCKFSVRATYQDSVAYYFSTEYVNLTNVAVDFTSEITSINTSGSPFVQGPVSYSNFIIRNAVGFAKIFSTAIRTGVILENPEFGSSPLQLTLSSSSYSYFAFVNPDFGHITITSGGTLNKVLCMIDNSTGTYTVSEATTVTASQLKDQAYLTEIGFLP